MIPVTEISFLRDFLLLFTFMVRPAYSEADLHNVFKIIDFVPIDCWFVYEVWVSLNFFITLMNFPVYAT